MRLLPLTPRQRGALSVLATRDRATARRIGVRSDVLWRLEERGLVGRNLHDEWYIKPAGRDALDAAEPSLGERR